MRRIVSTTVMSLALAGASACAAGYPEQPSGPVLDQAAIISDGAEGALDAKLRQYFTKTCRAVVVATVPSLNGESVEAYSMHLANAWKIGDPVRGDGVLLLVAPGERKVRIEVSRSLQTAIPDAAAAKIINGGMLARYGKGDYEGGILQGVDAILKRLDETASPHPECRPDRTQNT